MCGRESSRGGVDARSIKSREATLFRADGVVAHKPRFKTHSEARLVSDHPVCGAAVASRLFIDAAATPPHEEGNAPARIWWTI